MSEWRADPVTGQWTIVADDLPLARRDFVLDGVSRPLDTPCPLCEGRELTAGHEIAAVRDGTAADGPGWSLRVVPNRVPALRVEAGMSGAHEGLFIHRPGLGAHEVVVETPRHDVSWYTMTADELARIFTAWRDRMADLRRDGRLRAAVAFKNHGVEAGARLAHAHSQIVATPIVPPAITHEVEAARRHHTATGACLFCELVAQERAADVRVVADTTHFLALAPYASRTPFETWLLPVTHRARFDEASAADLAGLAALLRQVLEQVGRELERPAFNAVLHSAPFDEPGEGAYHWHLELMPRVLRANGLDVGAGLPVNPVPPEKAARVLRGGG
jgi:UDPglucose--hexose-1-phosphate uridylyltransferase